MKVIIMAGGLQSALSENLESIPKPMAEIAGKPLLWHIMKNFSTYGLHDFIVCGGFKVELIKEYFRDFYIFQSDITVDLMTNTIQIHKNISESWQVTIVDTGIGTEHGKRVLQVQDYIDGEYFFVTYGDCLSDIDYNAMTAHHMRDEKICTMALAHPTGRNKILPVTEKGLLMPEKEASLPKNQAWVDACCKIFDRRVFQYLVQNYTLENELQALLAEQGQITTYCHPGFWSPVETKRDQRSLELLWQKGIAPWKVWNK